MLKVGRKKLLVEAKKRKKRIVFLLFRLPFERQTIFFVFVVYSVLTENQSELDIFDETLAKEKPKTLVCAFSGSSKLFLYFEEWLLQRPALRST